MEKEILKAIEQAYIKGLNDGKNLKDISTFLLTSQVVANQILNKFYKNKFIKRYQFDCWGSDRKLRYKLIYAKTEKEAITLFKATYPDMSFDKPFIV